MGRQLAKDRLKNGVSSNARSFDVLGPLACFSTQVLELSHRCCLSLLTSWRILSGLPYLVSNVGRVIRFCKSFLFYHPYVDVVCCHFGGFACLHSRCFAFAVGYWRSRRSVFCGCGGGGNAISIFAHSCVCPFWWAYLSLELVMIVAAVSLACFMLFLIPWGKLFAAVA